MKISRQDLEKYGVITVETMEELNIEIDDMAYLDIYQAYINQTKDVPNRIYEASLEGLDVKDEYQTELDNRAIARQEIDRITGRR